MKPATFALGAGLVAGAAAWLWPGPTAEVPARVAQISRTGWVAAGLLLLSLSARPLGGRFAQRLAWRRALGLASALIAAVHVGVVWTAGWGLRWADLVTEPQLRSGATALGVLGLMAATSWGPLMRTLRLGHWPLLHRSVYAAAILLVHHVALSSHALPRALVAFAGGVLLLLLLRVRLPR